VPQVKLASFLFEKARSIDLALAETFKLEHVADQVKEIVATTRIRPTRTHRDLT